MKKITPFVFIISMLVLCSSAYAQLPGSMENRLRHVLDSVCAKHRLKGASVAVLVPHNGVWKGTYGESHAGVPITSEMMFDVASNTKTYVATLALKLQEMGKLSLDDSIGNWIRNVPNVNGQVTIRQLLNHTSGIGDYDSGNLGDAYNDSIFKDFNRIWKPEELLVKFPVSAPAFAPGAGWRYSNTNYVIASLIIKEVMNQPVSKSFYDLILTPHQLAHTVFFPDDPQANIPFPHIWSMNAGSGRVLVDFMEAFNYSNTSLITSGYGCGGIVTTAEDNVLFWHKLISGQVITPASFSEMTKYIQLPDRNWKYGLGMYRGQKDINGRVVYEHGGTSVGFVCENVVDSISGVCVSVLTNQDSIKNDVLLLEVVAALHKVTLQMPITGLGENRSNKVNMEVYPNPASEFIRVNIADGAYDLLLSLYNLTGQKVLAAPILNGSATIAVGALPAGLYIAQLTDKNNQPVAAQKIQLIK